MVILKLTAIYRQTYFMEMPKQAITKSLSPDKIYYLVQDMVLAMPYHENVNDLSVNQPSNAIEEFFCSISAEVLVARSVEGKNHAFTIVRYCEVPGLRAFFSTFVFIAFGIAFAMCTYVSLSSIL